MTAALTRLHISPLDPALLDSILGPTNRPLATNISFHTIPTFPEKSFGYVSLPAMEADKLRKKLNGSILKGKKLKVEAARPDPKETRKLSDSSDTQKKEKKEKKKSSKRKAEEEDGVLEGHELPADRHVKRGWTEPASSRKHKKQKKSDKEVKPTKPQTKSKYTEKAECLFKTKTPPNKTVTGNKGKKSKSDKPPNEVVVHEFAQTVTHPSFLKSTTQDQPVTAGFEEGKGWMDKDGQLKEAASEKVRKATFNPGKKDGAKERVSSKKSKLDGHSKKKEKQSTPITSPSESEEEPDWTSSSGSSSSDEDSSASESDSSDESISDDGSGESLASDEETPVTKAKSQSLNKPAHTETTKPVNEDKSENDASSKQEDSSEESDSASDKASSNEDSSDDSSSSSEDDTEEKKTNEVHPLEALFKRKDQQQEDANAGFSFFGGNNDDIEDEDEDEIHQPMSTEPLTPFTRRDRLVRNVRSAAPTPDTAMRSHTKLLTDEDEDMEDLDGDSYLPHTESSPSKPRDESVAQQPQETDFATWFWENRGDNNRAWKKRRRDAAKEKRQRDNRRKGMKGRG